jgi:hypothetical protein
MHKKHNKSEHFSLPSGRSCIGYQPGQPFSEPASSGLGLTLFWHTDLGE